MMSCLSTGFLKKSRNSFGFYGTTLLKTIIIKQPAYLESLAVSKHHDIKYLLNYCMRKPATW